MGVNTSTRRSIAPAFAVATATLAACGPLRQPQAHGGQSAIAAPPRRSGLWEQTIAKDGKPPRGHGFQICLDGAKDDGLWVFADAGPVGRCRRQISRGADGAYRFTSTCTIGEQAVVTSTGVVTGDFDSRYEVRSVLTVSGAPLPELDGRHAVALVAQYRGACPTGMTPGQISIGHGAKVDSHRLRQLASVFSGA